MKRNYKLVLVLFFAVSIVYAAFLVMSENYIKFREDIQYKKFNEGDSFYAPYKNDLPWEINVIYNEINSLSSENNLILIGASTTREGIVPEQLAIPAKWELKNMAIGADTIYSFRLMRNYLNSYANHKPDKTDIVVIHIFYGSFSIISPENDYLHQTIEVLGTYQVDDSAQVHGYMSGMRKLWELSNYKIRFALGLNEGPVGKSLVYAVRDFGTKSIRLVIGDPNEFHKSSPTAEDLAKYKTFWTAYTRNVTYPGKSTDDFKELLKELKSQTNVVVVNLYVPSWHRTYPSEQEYENWTRTDLIPFLNEQGISWIDLSRSIPDSEYGDSMHLFKRGRENYTKQFSAAINPILSDID